MKVKIQGFLGTNHSWRSVHLELARAFLHHGCNLHLHSTNGYKHFPDDLKKYIVHSPDRDYDMQLSYTAMINFGAYLAHGKKNRFGIWNYETTVLPNGFAKHYKFTDKMLPSSEFAKKVFADNKIPEEHLVVVPHGVNAWQFRNAKPYPLKTNKVYKILANIAQPHIRKNIPGLFESFGRAFTKDDDVCLVIKISKSGQKERAIFNVDFDKELKKFKDKYRNHAEIEVVDHFIDDIGEIYAACDIVYSVTNAECFWLPGLEAMAADRLVIAPNWGGQLQYMNSDNSLLIEGKEGRASRQMQYWTASPYAVTFNPDLDHAAERLKEAVKNFHELKKKFRIPMEQTVQQLSWNNVGKQILELCE